MTITELTDLLFHDIDSAEIFMRGVYLQGGFEIIGLMIATIRLMRTHSTNN